MDNPVSGGSSVELPATRPVKCTARCWLVLLTQVVYWLAHEYAEVVGERIRTRDRPRPRAVRHLLDEEWPLVAASFAPLAVIVVCSALEVSANSAVLAGLWATMALLAGWALLAGYRSQLRAQEVCLPTWR